MDSLRIENRQLKNALKDVLWMAAEFASKEKVFAPYIVNQAIDVARRYRIPLNQGYVRDRYLGHWNPRLGYFDYREYEDDDDQDKNDEIILKMKKSN